MRVLRVKSNLKSIPAGLTRGVQADFHGKKCSSCKSIISDKTFASEKYSSGFYSNNENYKRAIPGYDYTGDFVRRILKFADGERILDFGAGQGTTAEFIQNQGGLIDVLEPDRGFQEDLGSIFENVYVSSGELKQKYRVIYAIGVLEHLDDIKQTFHLLSEKLQDGGVMIFQYPNVNSLSARLALKFWDMIFEPGHNFIPSEKGLKKFLQDSELEIVDGYSSSILSRGRVPWFPIRFDKIERNMIKLTRSSSVVRCIYEKLWQLQSRVGLGETLVVTIQKRREAQE